MPNYTKKRHRTSRKKIGGVKKDSSPPQSQYFTNWQGRYGEPGSIAVDLRKFQRSRQPHIDPETSIADNLKRYLRNVTRHYGNKISDSRTMNALRSLLSRAPPPATIVESPSSSAIQKSGTKPRRKSRRRRS